MRRRGRHSLLPQLNRASLKSDIAKAVVKGHGMAGKTSTARASPVPCSSWARWRYDDEFTDDEEDTSTKTKKTKKMGPRRCRYYHRRRHYHWR